MRPLTQHRRLVVAAWQRIRGKGYSIPASMAHLAAAILQRTYRAALKHLNRVGPLRTHNTRRFRKFHTAFGRPASGHFYVIVMPGVLHFLLPCLRLLPDTLKV